MLQCLYSQPIPLEYLRLASFDALPENRREKATSTVEQTRLFDSFRVRHKPMYPFTIYHASTTMTRRYTLYAATDGDRKKWQNALNEAIELRRTQQDANKVYVARNTPTRYAHMETQWYESKNVNEGFFRISNGLASQISSGRITGKIRTATTFSKPALLIRGNYIALTLSQWSKASPLSLWAVSPGYMSARRRSPVRYLSTQAN